MILGSLYCKLNTREQSDQGSYCVLQDKIQSEVQLNKCNRHKKQMTFLEKKYSGRVRDNNVECLFDCVRLKGNFT